MPSFYHDRFTYDPQNTMTHARHGTALSSIGTKSELLKFHAQQMVVLTSYGVACNACVAPIVVPVPVVQFVELVGPDSLPALLVPKPMK